MDNTTRRDMLAVAAATVTLPMLDAALGKMRGAEGASRPSTQPGTRPSTQPSTRPSTGPAKESWTATTVKAADVKEDQFTAVAGQKVLLSRTGKTVCALTSVCTHRQCEIKPTEGQKILTCGCHRSEFNLDGTVAKAPATKPLDHHAIRVNDKGLIEIDVTQKVEKDGKGYSVTVA